MMARFPRAFGGVSNSADAPLASTCVTITSAGIAGLNDASESSTSRACASVASAGIGGFARAFAKNALSSALLPVEISVCTKPGFISASPRRARLSESDVLVHEEYTAQRLTHQNSWLRRAHATQLLVAKCSGNPTFCLAPD